MVHRLTLGVMMLASPAWASYVVPTRVPTPTPANTPVPTATAVPTATPANTPVPTATVVPTATPVVDSGGSYKPPAYAVGSLPTCDAAKTYALAAVNDATACVSGAAPVAGALVKCVVWCNGATWLEL